MKPLALSPVRPAVDPPVRATRFMSSAAPPAAGSAATRAQRRAVGPPLAFAADTGPAWADTQPGYHVRHFHAPPPEDPPGSPAQV